MAVVSVNEIAPGRYGTGDAHEPLQGSVRRAWRIVTDSSSDNTITIQSHATFQASDIPKVFGAVHPDNIFFTCRSLTINQESDTAIVWIAEAEYSNQPISQDEQERANTPNPLERLPRFRVLKRPDQRYVDKDVNDKSYENSAGEPYPPQVRRFNRPVLHITQNVSQWTTAWWNYINPPSKNDAGIKISDGYSEIQFNQGEALLESLEIGSLQKENGISYYQLTAEVAVDAVDLWVVKLKDQGFHWKDSVTNKMHRIKVLDSDEEGNPTSSLIDSPVEQLLNGEGKPLRWPDGTLSNGSISTPQFIEFEEAIERDFSELPFFTATA